MKISHKKQKYIGNVLKILQGFKIKSPEETIDKIIKLLVKIFKRRKK